MKIVYPPKLKENDHIRVIAPSRSMKIIAHKHIKLAQERLKSIGLSTSFGNNIFEIDDFNSSSIESRINDLHDAFSDNSVQGILTAIGGYSANQLLDYIDYNLIANNPKVLCGFSDITVLSNAILKKTGLVTYTGPHFSSWAIKKGFNFSINFFQKSCMSNKPYELSFSQVWSDDPWYLDEDNREFIQNDGYWVINPGKASGITVGNHARSFSLLQGTQYWTGFNGKILLIEENEDINPQSFDQLLQSYIHQSDFSGLRGLIIGRFQKATKMTREFLEKIIHSKRELKNLPVIANANFGHTMPLATLPIGGEISIDAEDINNLKIIVTNH